MDNQKNSSSKIEPELNQLRVRRAELEKELESVKVTIERHESNLIQTPQCYQTEEARNADQGQRRQSYS